MADAQSGKERPELKQQLRSEMLTKMAEIRDDFESNRFYQRHWVHKRKIREKLLRRGLGAEKV